MASRWWGVGILLIAAGLAGAGEGSPYEQAVKKMLGSLDKITSALKTIESEDTAKSAGPDLRKAADTWVEARAKAAKLPPPERDEKERLAKLYKPKMDEALKKMFTEIQRVNGIPGGKEALKEIASVLKKDGK